jgi:hypothetical protein
MSSNSMPANRSDKSSRFIKQREEKVGVFVLYSDLYMRWLCSSTLSREQLCRQWL